MLRFQHLTKRFGTAPLFTDLCMEVDAPVVLWAPSGWGKTTLLRILMGLERPTTGSVEGVGRVAAVFQEDRLCPQLNAVQNVTLVLPGAENQYKEQIINDFQQIGMDAAALQLPARRLSGGQKRRVALLRALWAPSDTLLLDEPFTGMDPDTLQRAAALLRQRCAGKPVLLATHDESAIRALGWPVVELEKLGLAAPQVGMLKRIVVIDIGDENGPYVLINPVIIETAGEQRGYEGCLSVPGMAGQVTRPNYVKVKALDEDMNEVEYEGEGLLARAFCHEIDHLDGHMYTELVEGELHQVSYDEDEE